MKTLIVVESPAKARALRRIAGKDTTVIATAGHIHELPRRPSDIPEAYRQASWAKLGLNPDDDFRPLNIPTSQGNKVIPALRAAAATHERVILATDDDREGAAIARSVTRELALDEQRVIRAPLRELTRQGWEDALAQARPLSADNGLCQAQETRRAADRLIGYTFSPVAWKRVGPGTAVGRVQTAAAGMVIRREMSRLAFRPLPVTQLSVKATLAGRTLEFEAVSVNGLPLAGQGDHDPETGSHLRGERLSEEDVSLIRSRLLTGEVQLSAARQHTETMTVPPPEAFDTAGALQAICEQTGLPPRLAAATLQRLYERGLITYPRTDSTAISPRGAAQLREQVSLDWGEHLNEQPGQLEPGVHEAIRPAGAMTEPRGVRGLNSEELAAYTLIYERALASQMEPAQISVTTTTAELNVAGRTFGLQARESRTVHAGHLALQPG